MSLKTLTRKSLTEEFSALIPIAANALPVCIAVGLAATIGLVDVHLAGDLGAAVQAGVGIGDQFLFFAALLGTGIAQGAASLIARATGGKDGQTAAEFAEAGVILSLIFGMTASIVILTCADFLLAVFTQDSVARHSGATYLKLCAIANAPYGAMLTQSAILRAAGKSFSTVFPWFVAAALSVSLSITLPKIMPDGKAHTVEYIALAWNIGALAAAFIGHHQLRKAGFSVLDHLRSFDKQLGKIRKIILLGLPIAATEAAWLGSNFVMYSILSQMSSANDAQAAWTIRLKVEEIAATPAMLAFSMTAASLVGQKFGAGDLAGARDTMYKTSIASAILMFIVGVGVFLFNKPLAADYAVTPLSCRYAQVLLCASILVYPIAAFYMTIFGALEGAGCTLKPMLAVVAGLFVLRIPLAAWLSLQLDFGMTGIAISIVVSHFAVALSAISQANALATSKAHRFESRFIAAFGSYLWGSQKG